MAVLSVKEVLAEISASQKANGDYNHNRFNRKSFNKLVKAMMNDVEFEVEVAKVKKGQLDSVEKVNPGMEFRKFCKRVIEKCGIDKKESERILTKEFQFDNVDGFYELASNAIYEYLNSGNRFDFPARPDFKGSIALKKVGKTTKVTSAHSPQTREYLGDFEVTKDAHKVLIVKSPCPSYLKHRRKVK